MLKLHLNGETTEHNSTTLHVQTNETEADFYVSLVNDKIHLIPDPIHHTKNTKSHRLTIDAYMAQVKDTKSFLRLFIAKMVFFNRNKHSLKCDKISDLDEEDIYKTMRRDETIIKLYDPIHPFNIGNCLVHVLTIYYKYHQRISKDWIGCINWYARYFASEYCDCYMSQVSDTKQNFNVFFVIIYLYLCTVAYIFNPSMRRVSYMTPN